MTRRARRRAAGAAVLGVLAATWAASGLALTPVAAAAATGSSAADVGFPWGWTLVAAVGAAGIAATVAALRRNRSIADAGTAAAYGQARALIDSGRAAVQGSPGVAASWRGLDDEAGDVLSALHTAAARRDSPAAFGDAVAAIEAVSAAFGAAAEAAADSDRLPLILDEVDGRLDDAERALEPLKAVP